MNEDFIGPDLFGYTIVDEDGHESSITVNLSVIDPEAPAPALQADDDSATTAKNTVITFNVLDNDENYVGVPFDLTNPDHGSVSVDGNGNVVYTPDNNYLGEDSFQYTIADEN